MLIALTVFLIALASFLMMARHLRARRRVDRLQSRLIRALHIPAGKAGGLLFRREGPVRGQGLALAGRRG